MSYTAVIGSTPINHATEKSVGVEETALKAPMQNGTTHDHTSGEDLDKAHGTTGACPFRTPPLTGMNIYGKAQKELERIRNAHRTLAPTGCTPDFCQSGRMTRINEPRVGRDRPLAEIQQEAVDFLRECRDHGVIETNEALDKRMREALVQISNTAIVSTITDRDGNVSEGLAGGTWHQHPAELEYGLRAAWRNARRCIMRSEHAHLALCDLRRVQSSREMARTIAKGMQDAFNRGHILPTVFAFPPRQPGKRGPMIWNHQMMAFAGYRQADGSILGDPANVELTASMIEFGWKPPINRSRWDMLPLVTMAETDAPYMMELPLELRRTVQIRHPRYEKEFRDLDLQWVLAPALSRLGFDIGGNQYTATPFIGWFMDSEIGVRDLADTFRYNALPDVVNALRLSPEPETPLEELPEYMHLVALVSSSSCWKLEVGRC
jgi:nitric oxide synthase oxygenase domain/subunit